MSSPDRDDRNPGISLMVLRATDFGAQETPAYRNTEYQNVIFDDDDFPVFRNQDNTAQLTRLLVSGQKFVNLQRSTRPNQSAPLR